MTIIRWRPGLLDLATTLVAVGFLLPIAAGLYETVKPAFGLLPAIGADDLSLEPWRRLVDMPGFWTSLRLTVVTGFAATIVALLLAVSLLSLLHRFGQLDRMARALAPLLAAPHAAVAIGLAFLLSPSGWLVRLVSPLVSGWQVPPQIVTIQDGPGLAMIAGLVAKELPFLLLVLMAALRQIAVDRQLAAATALGYRPAAAWLFIILPQAYRQIRLPVYAALSFSLSVVDVALVLGPGHPPPLAVMAVRWFQSADLSLLRQASAAALLIGAVAVCGMGVWRLGEWLGAIAGRHMLRRGMRGGPPAAVTFFLNLCALTILASGMFGLLLLAVWSFAFRWPFPAWWPDSVTLAGWLKAAQTGTDLMFHSLVLALGSTALAILLAVMWLEGEDRAGQRPRIRMALVYLPLVIPQVAFLFGLNVAFLRLGLGGGLGSVTWAHALFVFPYVMLALGDPWRALDPRYGRAGSALGASPLRVLIRLKLPLLAGPIATAAAIGFSVSIAQYLATLFIGAGRVPTLTTEAVALSSGGDRRLVGVYGTLQALLPLACFLLATLAPRLSRLPGTPKRGIIR